MERQGYINRESFGTQIEKTLDYHANPGTAFLTSDMATTSLAKTEVLTAALYDVAELAVPVVWSKGDDAKNPTENQKVPLVKSLLTNGFNSHDNAIEQAMFATSTNGFLGWPTLLPVSGQGICGGIDAGTETFWRNPVGGYLADGSDLEAVLTSAWNDATKGSGAQLSVKMLHSGSHAQSLFESTQQAQQRYVDTEELKVGFKILAFKTSRYVYSQYGDDKIYGSNPQSFMLDVSRQYFRDKGETQEIANVNAFVFKIYSALQLSCNNKSRGFVCYQS